MVMALTCIVAVFVSREGPEGGVREGGGEWR